MLQKIILKFVLLKNQESSMFVGVPESLTFSVLERKNITYDAYLNQRVLAYCLGHLIIS